MKDCPKKDYLNGFEFMVSKCSNFLEEIQSGSKRDSQGQTKINICFRSSSIFSYHTQNKKVKKNKNCGHPLDRKHDFFLVWPKQCGNLQEMLSDGVE